MSEDTRHSVFERMPIIRPLLANQLERLNILAAEDNHKVVAPTHTVQKNNEIVGYLSHGAIPTVLCWLSTTRVKATDTVHILNNMEEMSVFKGYKYILVPCSENSPYRPYMEKFGYHNHGLSNMFTRQLV